MVWDAIHDPKTSLFCDVDGAQVWADKTPKGYVLRAKIPPAASGGISEFRGEYDPTASYNVGDEVVISGGANAGSYVCIQANSATTPQLPDTGNLYWVSLSGNAPVMGAWMV